MLVSWKIRAKMFRTVVKNWKKKKSHIEKKISHFIWKTGLKCHCVESCKGYNSSDLYVEWFIKSEFLLFMSSLSYSVLLYCHFTWRPGVLCIIENVVKRHRNSVKHCDSISRSLEHFDLGFGQEIEITTWIRLYHYISFSHLYLTVHDCPCKSFWFLTFFVASPAKSLV